MTCAFYPLRHSNLFICSTQFNGFIYGVGSVYFAVCAVIVNDLLSLRNVFRIREFVYGIFYIRHFSNSFFDYLQVFMLTTLYCIAYRLSITIYQWRQKR